jgi:hypothetical protein
VPFGVPTGPFSASDLPDASPSSKGGVYATFINVKNCGAVGNGVADDTVAIQAAITASEAVPSGALVTQPVVHFPPGVYRVSSTINSTRLLIRGDQPNSVVRILWDGPANGDCFVNTPSSSYSNFGLVEGINFRNGTNKPGRWIKFNNGIDNQFRISPAVAVVS